MPTVIDELIFELKLDPKKFTEGQKEATKQLRQFEREHEKHAAKLAKQTDYLSQSLSALQSRLLSVGALFAAGVGIVGFTEKIAKLTAANGYFAASLGATATEMGKWQNVGAAFGASADEMRQGFAVINQSMAAFQVGGQSNLLKLMQSSQTDGIGKGFNLYDAKTGKWKSTTENLMSISDWASSRPDKAVTSNMLGQAGFSQGMINVLLQGPEKLAALMKEMDKYAPTEEQVKRAQKLQEALAKTTAATEDLGRAMMERLAPALTDILGKITKWLDNIPQAVKDGPAATVGKPLGELGIEAYKWYSNPWKGMKNLYNKGRSYFGGGGEDATSPGGMSGTPGGGTRGDRNRNPGNIKDGPFARKMGATGADEKGFAIFPTLEAGRAAADKLLQENYSGLSLSQIQEKWVGNSDVGYMRGLMGATGLKAGDVPDMNDPAMRQKILQGITRGEGTSLTGELKGGGGRSNFMNGDPRAAELTTITTSGGRRVTVNKASAPYMLGFLNDMEAAGAPIKDIGGYNFRKKVGSPGWSQHAYGNAIDINQRGFNVVSPEFQAWSNQNRAKIEQISNKWGMINGGNWRKPDYGHWEWGGATSGLALGARGGLAAGNSTTNNNNNTSTTSIDQLNVTVPQGADPVGYASGIKQELQRYDNVMNSNTGLF